MWYIVWNILVVLTILTFLSLCVWPIIVAIAKMLNYGFIAWAQKECDDEFNIRRNWYDVYSSDRRKRKQGQEPHHPRR